MSGHIRRRGERSWELNFELGSDPVTGKRVTKYRAFKGTRKEASAELVRLINSAHQGDYIDPSKVTVSEFFDRWLRDWAAINVGAKTLERYHELTSAHIQPHTGAVPIQKLQAVHLAELYAKLLRKGNRQRGKPTQTVSLHARSPTCIGSCTRRSRSRLNGALSKRNAAEMARPPKLERTKIEILSVEQARTLIEKLKGHPLYPIVVLALATGMRRGELLALRWKDVDLDSGKLRVEQSLEQTKIGGVRFKAPKTKHGRRAISLASSVVTELRLHRKQQQEQRLQLGFGKAPDDALVFPKWDGTPRALATTSTEWTRTLAKLKLPAVSLHALHHTHASQLIAEGMDVLTISRRLGHGSPTITLDIYGHLFGNTDDRAADVIKRAFGKVLARRTRLRTAGAQIRNCRVAIRWQFALSIPDRIVKMLDKQGPKGASVGFATGLVIRLDAAFPPARR